MLPVLVTLRLAALAPVPELPPPPDPRELELHWRAPAGCPAQDELERRIHALLPAEPSGEGVLVIDGEVTRAAAAASLELRSSFQGRTETRTVTAPSCDELTETTAMLVAIALEPSAAITSPPSPIVPEPSSAPAPPPDAAPPPTAVPSAPPSVAVVGAGTAAVLPRPRRAGPGLGLRVTVGVEAGAIPPPSLAVAAAASLLWSRARLELTGAWLVPRTVRAEDGRGATYQLGSVGLRGCGRVFVRALELPLCAGAEAGVLRARPRAIEGARVLAPWAAAIAGVGVARRWGPAAIFANVEGVVRLVGNRFLVDGRPSLQQWPVSLRALVGVELRWGDRSRGR